MLPISFAAAPSEKRKDRFHVETFSSSGSRIIVSKIRLQEQRTEKTFHQQFSRMRKLAFLRFVCSPSLVSPLVRVYLEPKVLSG